MTLQQLEQRIATVEREVASLKAALSNGGKLNDWRSLFDFFDKHPGMHEVFEEGMKLREKDRAKARRRKSPSRRAKS